MQADLTRGAIFVNTVHRLAWAVDGSRFMCCVCLSFCCHSPESESLVNTRFLISLYGKWLACLLILSPPRAFIDLLMDIHLNTVANLGGDPREQRGLPFLLRMLILAIYSHLQ